MTLAERKKPKRKLQDYSAGLEGIDTYRMLVNADRRKNCTLKRLQLSIDWKRDWKRSLLWEYDLFSMHYG